MLQAAGAARVPAAVVLVHGGAMAIESIKDVAPAILDAGYPSVSLRPTCHPAAATILL